MTTKYILESSNGNDRILALQPDGTYKSIANCHGDFGSDEAKKMLELANSDCSGHMLSEFRA